MQISRKKREITAWLAVARGNLGSAKLRVTWNRVLDPAVLVNWVIGTRAVRVG
jgi:hypothetical protein